MGILGDILVATEQDALAYDASLEFRKSPTAAITVVYYKSFTGLEFGTLWALASGEPFEMRRHKLRHISHGDEGERWLEAFPEELVAVLSALPEAELASLAARWAATDELRLSHMLPEHAEPVVRDLRRLAAQARHEGKGMYLWGSL